MASAWFDLKYAWRLSIGAWRHSLLCVGVVALSVGLALWTYVLAYSQAFRPLAFSGSERWYSLQLAAAASAPARPNVDAFTYQELSSRARSLSHLGAFANRTVVLSEGHASTSLRGAAISPRLLAATRVPPLLGRLFADAEAEPGAEPSVILSFDAWQRYFAGDRAIVGKHVRIDGRPVPVVGVMPRDFYAFRDYELWLPLQLRTLARPSDSTEALSPLLSLREGDSFDAVSRELQAIVGDVNGHYPGLFDSGRHLELIPAHRMTTHAQMPVVLMLCVVAVAVLLLGCANISMMFLARLLERSRELALRIALGATRARLLRQCLLETSFVVVLGLLLGCELAAMGVRWAHGIGAAGAQMRGAGRVPNELELRPVDLVAALIAAAAIWLLSTAIPVRRIVRQDPALVLAGSGKGTADRRGGRGAGLLVGLQVVISCMVLVICGNLVLAVHAELDKPTGLKPAEVVVSTAPTAFAARHAGATARLQYWDELTASVAVRSTGAEVAYASTLPARGPQVAPSIEAALETREGGGRRTALTLPLTAVSDNYFALLGIGLRSGRLFEPGDDGASFGVAIVDEHLARRYWPDQVVLGKRIQLSPSNAGSWLTIVGVVAGVAGRPYAPASGMIYRPLRQAAPPAFHLLARLPRAAGDGRAALRAAAFAVDRDLPLHNLQMLDRYLEAATMIYSTLIPVFITIAAITALLAATGLLGLISRSVALRTQEVGVRRAVGGSPWQVAAVFLRQGVLYLGVGVGGGCLGVAITNALGATIPNALDHVVAVSSAVFVLVALVIFAASYLPARRAVALEPGDALRYE